MGLTDPITDRLVFVSCLLTMTYWCSRPLTPTKDLADVCLWRPFLSTPSVNPGLPSGKRRTSGRQDLSRDASPLLCPVSVDREKTWCRLFRSKFRRLPRSRRGSYLVDRVGRPEPVIPGLGPGEGVLWTGPRLDPSPLVGGREEGEEEEKPNVTITRVSDEKKVSLLFSWKTWSRTYEKGDSRSFLGPSLLTFLLRGRSEVDRLFRHVDCGSSSRVSFAVERNPSTPEPLHRRRSVS